MNTCGKSDLYNAKKNTFIDMQFSDIKVAHSVLSSQAHNDQNRRNDLRDYGCQSNACHIHGKEIYENKIVEISGLIEEIGFGKNKD